ncbi:Flp family type IVb pilin [Roseomonas sp. CCTCC AB2023176]|uniref:Flp family type IVb pilin n=1 Tax=Roseomonas sp. CCTCC AB2023176 TaxID=3342640 RepID=UPI0035D571E7
MVLLKQIKTIVGAAVHDRRGVTAAEYAVLAAGIVVAVGGLAAVLKPKLEGAINALTLTGTAG